ncbi:MAG: glycerol kinase, partial [Clostridia bacterium]|nr:glycerol kinase [Clostridia bacterium]
MKPYLLSLDEGTTSARAVLFDRNGQAVSSAQVEFRQIYPQPGFVEHDPFDILNAQIRAIDGALAKIGANPDQIAGVGITNQRETVVVWDKQTGKPVNNAIV